MRKIAKCENYLTLLSRWTRYDTSPEQQEFQQATEQGKPMTWNDRMAVVAFDLGPGLVMNND